MTINKLRYCFTFCNREYVFKKKLLYQQKYIKNNRYYSEREIKPKANGYYIQGLYISNESIKKLLQQKKIKEEIINENAF